MPQFPPKVDHQLAGWVLFWADLELVPGAEAALAALRRDLTARARGRYVLEKMPEHPTAAAVRKLFRAAGCDPTRYRPSSEALIRRLLKGEDLPPIHPLVDLNNCLSVELGVPACVMDLGTLQPPFVLRAGAPGEGMQSLRGPIDLEGKPLLADGGGPFSTPITDSERVRVGGTSRRVWHVAYLPAGAVPPEAAARSLATLLAAAPVARMHGTCITGV